VFLKCTRCKNPTIQALFPYSTTLNILRTLTGDLSPVPNVTSFGPDGSIYAQLFYNGVEQFYCQAASCVHTDDSSGASDWTCQNLQCTCRSGTDFCGKNITTDISGTINTLSGSVDLSCQAPPSIGQPSTCSFIQTTLQQLFGSNGLSLSGCQFGECVSQSVIENPGSNSTNSQQTAKSLSGGVIAGLAVVGCLLFFALLVILAGYYIQQRARRGTAERKYGGIGVEWKQLSYFVPPPQTFISSLTRKKSNCSRAILDRVSGHVKAGEIMAILGPSGAGKTTLVELLSGKSKLGDVMGSIQFLEADGTPLRRKPRIGFVDQVEWETKVHLSLLINP
jgi:ABC-type multidrug transport system fused ATPase/permease subunit